MKPATAAVHADHAVPGASDEADVAPAIHLSTTFSRRPAFTPNQAKEHIQSEQTGKQPTPYSSHDTYVYSRADQPTRARAEAVLAALEGAPDPRCALLYSSGLAAVSALLVRTLPRTIALDAGYMSTISAIEQYRRLVAGPLVKRGNLKDEKDEKPVAKVVVWTLEELRQNLDAGGSGADLIFIETPRNPDTKLIDIQVTAGLAAKCTPKAMLAVDSTFASPVSCRPLSLGADFVMHSATKILGGHSDLMGGVVVCKDQIVASRLHAERTTAGNIMGAMESWLLLRSLRTLPLRVKRCGESAVALASWLEARTAEEPVADTTEFNAEGKKSKKSKKSKKGQASNAKKHSAPAAEASVPSARLVSVSHCWLPSHRDNKLAMRQLDVPPYCFSFELSSAVHAEHLAEFTELFQNATSLGGCESLLDWRYRFDADVSPRLVRVSVGLEDVEDLQNDLAQALTRVAAAWPVDADGKLL